MKTTPEQINLLLASVTEFFQNKTNENKLLQLYRDDDPSMSMRILEWFVTNYSKKNFVAYNLRVHPDGRPVADEDVVEDETRLSVIRFHVYQQYKAVLKSFGKVWFDTFSRDLKQNYYDPVLHRYYKISLGQLNFFRWAIQHRIMENIKEHYQDVVREMSLVAARKTHDLNQYKQEPAAAAAAAVAVAAPQLMNPHPPHAANKTRKRRVELSVSACRCLKKEHGEVIVKFT